MTTKKDVEQCFEISRSDVREDSLPPNSYMVKPCEWYKEEYKDCKSIRARFNQYYIYGEITDCQQWKTDYDSCMKFRKTGIANNLESVIDSEIKQKEARAEKARQNDVWEYRTAPPENWNAELPEWMKENKKDSHLEQIQNLLNQGVEPPAYSKMTCAIL